LFLCLCIILVVGLHLTLVKSVDATVKNGKLVAAVVIMRHGDRAPQRHAPAFAEGSRLKYETVFAIDKGDWPVDYGQLTPLGVQQAYNLGSRFNARYVTGLDSNKLLSATYDHIQTHARATDVDRTLTTAMAVLAGIYPARASNLTNNGAVNNSSPVSQQLVPVHTVEYALDSLLDGSAKAHCPVFNSASKIQKKNNKRLKYLLYSNTAFLKALPALSGISLSALDHMGTKKLVSLTTSLRDLRVCQRAHNVSQPKNVTHFDSFLEEFTAAVVHAKWIESGLGSIVGGRLLRAVARRLELVRQLELGEEWVVDRLHDECNAKGQDSDESGECPRRFVLYVGHDTTLFDTRAALGLSVTQPAVAPYTAHLVFELRRSDSGDFSVQILSGDYERETVPVSGPFCNHDSSCSLSNFITWVRHTVPKNVDKACGAKRDGSGLFKPPQNRLVLAENSADERNDGFLYRYLVPALSGLCCFVLGAFSVWISAFKRPNRSIAYTRI